MAEECLPCVEKTRKRLVTLGLMTGGCSMLGTAQEREACQKIVESYSDEDITNSTKMGEFFADLIKKGDVELFKQYFEKYVNRMQAEWFVAGVDHLKSKGETVSPTVLSTYQFYKGELARMNGAKEISI